MTISDNLQNIKNSLPQEVTLVAVSKTKPLEKILEAYNTGHRVFGENKVQEMTEKWEQLPKDIQWHMIGHLQRNKVKYMAPFVSLVHGVDSLKLLKEINKQAKKNDRTIECLLQIHIAKEDTKFGLDEKELLSLLNSEEYYGMRNIKIIGLMGMATFTDDKQQIADEFRFLKELYDRLAPIHSWHILSMGMSGDFSVAIELGSNMVRIGSAIFGERE